MIGLMRLEHFARKSRLCNRVGISWLLAQTIAQPQPQTISTAFVGRRTSNSISQNGTTIVELLVTIVMTGVIASAMIVFMVSSLHTFGAASAKANLLGQAQIAVERISNDIMLSATADANNRIPDAHSPIAIDPLGWVGDSDTLILATAAEDQSKNILFADSAQYITEKNNVIYYLDGQKLRRRVLANDVVGNRAVTTCPSNLATAACPADSVMLGEVQNYIVTYYNQLNQVVQPDDARSVQVSVVLQSKIFDNARVSYKTRTVFRND